MSGLTTLLGETITGKVGPVQVSSMAKAGHVVGLYFTERGCSICQEFLPTLVQWYKDMRDGDVGTKLEIVFIRSNESQEEFDEYYEEMPWTALSYDPTITEEKKLYKKFKIPDTPALVFLEADTGKLINKNGHSVVKRNKTGEDFPWLPKTLSDILTGPVLSKSGEIDLKTAREGKVLGIYFSAESCGPCEYFTPKLIESYINLKKAGKDFEVVLVSWDDDEQEFERYYKGMPWLALPFNDDRVVELGEHFHVRGIPKLIILDENLEVLTDRGTRASGAMSKHEGQYFVPPPLLELSEIYGGFNNKNLVFFTDGNDDLIAQAQSLMQEVAEETAAATKASHGTENEVEPILMLYEDKDAGEHAAFLRQYSHVETPGPCLVYMNDDEEMKHVIDNPADLTKENFRAMVSKIIDGTIETVPFGD